MFKFSPCPLPRLSTVWLYLRDSGGDNQDLSSQRAYGLAYCEHYQLRLARIFEDSAISGGSVKGRDEFTAMIDQARAGKRPLVDAILYWDIKRFARDQLDAQFFKAELRRRGYRLISLSDDIPDNDFAPMIEAFLEWKAQQDRKDLSKDIRRGMSHIVSLRDEAGNYLGIFPGAAPTFFAGVPYDTGLKRNDGSSRILQRLVPDPKTWELGRRAWEMRAGRTSYQDIETALHIFPQNRNPSPSYYHLFRNEIYIGRLHYSGQVYDDFVPALATPEQWARVQELNYSRPQSGATFPVDKLHPKAGRGEFLLSGLCQCLHCGSNIHGSTNRRRERQTAWRYYICATKDKRSNECRDSKRLAAQKIERVIVDLVLSRILTADFVLRLTEQVNDFLNDTSAIQNEIERQQKHLADIRRAIGNLVDTIEIAPSRDLSERLAQRQKERDVSALEIARLQERLSRQNYIVDTDRVLKSLTGVQSTLRTGGVQARQVILQSALIKVELGRDRGRIHYQFPFTLVYLERVNLSELNPIQIYNFQY